jgi:ABC-2 type transport system ATP-binding protein
MSAPAIQTTGLTKHYGDVRALHDLDLEVRRGEVFGFLGPNGAGKSTTIRTLLDLIRPTSGSARLLGMDSRTASVQIRKHLGYLPSDLALYPRLTGRDTLRYFANLRGGVDWSHVDQLAERLGADLSKRVSDYSSGNRQKVGIIQAVMHRPDLVIMDEPSTGLDPLVQQEFQALLREVADDGRTVFLSSHTLSEVQRVADRVGVIRQGHLVDVETVQDLRSKAIRRVELVYEHPVDAGPFRQLDGVREVEAGDSAVTITFDGEMGDLLEVATVQGHLRDIATAEADLEEIFLAYYQQGAPPPDGNGAPSPDGRPEVGTSPRMGA